MTFRKIALFTLLMLSVGHELLAQSFFNDKYPEVWQRATAYTLEVAAAMPAEKYDFRPAPEAMTFHSQMTHLVTNLAFLTEKIIGTRPDFFKGQDPEKLSKEDIQLALTAAFASVDRLIGTIDTAILQEEIIFGGVTMPKENIFYLMRDHATHHRAQTILYLRMNDIEAPKYRGW